MAKNIPEIAVFTCDTVQANTELTIHYAPSSLEASTYSTVAVAQVSDYISRLETPPWLQVCVWHDFMLCQ